MSVRVAALISGRGSNMQALHAAQTPAGPYAIALVLSNRPDAAGLAYAKTNAIQTAVVDHKPFGKDREAFERAVHEELLRNRIEFVALAGFMRVLTPWLVSQWRGRMINIHPALLPSYKGLDTHARALADGVKIHGCTVHHVSEGVDEGVIIGQAAVPVFPHDDVDSLSARVLAVEHKLYPQCLALAVGGGANHVDLGPLVSAYS
jgi:formyltetrahydrofolate-dependent phosphoribosylglycinamide formyltransferase